MSSIKKEVMRRKIIVNIVLLMCFCLALLTASLIMRHRLIENARDLNTLIINNYSKDEENEIGTYFTMLNLGTKYIDGLEQEKSTVDEIQADLYPYIAGFYSLYDGEAVRCYGVIDGTIISTEAELENFDDGVYNYKEREWYQGALESGGEIYMTDAYKDYITGKVIVTISQKAEHSDSVLSFDIFFEGYHGEDGVENLPDGAAYYLVDETGTPLYYETTVFDNYEQVDNFASEVLSKVDPDAENGYIDKYLDNRGNYRSAFTRKMQNGWWLIFTIPRKNAIGETDILNIVVGVLFLIGALVIAYLAVRDYYQEKKKQALLEEHQAMEHKNMIYQKTMNSTAIAYREYRI
jgi:hypothetical protein